MRRQRLDALGWTAATSALLAEEAGDGRWHQDRTLAEPQMAPSVDSDHIVEAQQQDTAERGAVEQRDSA